MGGYDYNFVELIPDELTCLICMLVAREPWQMDCCGRVFCEACLEELRKRTRVLPIKCPNCREQGKSFADRRGARNINALSVKCSNADKGCEWVGELRSFEDHLEGCGFELIVCPNHCKNGGEDNVVLRSELDAHLQHECRNRRYKCPQCNEKGRYFEMTTNHLIECPAQELPCPNECGEIVVYRNLGKHCRSVCPNEMVACKYAELGCPTKRLRSGMGSHEDDDGLHLQLAMDTVVDMKGTVSDLKKTVSRLKHAQEAVVFRVPHFSRMRASSFSQPFYSHQGGYKMRLSVDPWGVPIPPREMVDDPDFDPEEAPPHIAVFTYLLSGKSDDNLVWPFRGKVKVKFLNQLEDQNHWEGEIVYDDSADKVFSGRVTDARSSGGYGGDMIPHAMLEYNPQLRCQYLKDDCLYVQIEVEVTEANKPWLTCTGKL